MSKVLDIDRIWNDWLQNELANHNSKKVSVFSKSSKSNFEQDKLGMIVDSLADVAGAKVEHSSFRKPTDLENLVLDPEMAEITEAIERYAKDQVQYYEEEEKKKTVVYYYVDHKPDEKKADYYIFTPDWVTIIRAPKEELGDGVLGVAYLGMNVIKILDTLYGDDLVEVKKHELLHLQHPYQSESWIRQRTKMELGFQTKYQ